MNIFSHSIGCLFTPLIVSFIVQLVLSLFYSILFYFGCAQASHSSGFSCCRPQTLGYSGFSICGSQALEHRHTGLVAPWHVESSWIRDLTLVPWSAVKFILMECFRWILLNSCSLESTYSYNSIMISQYFVVLTM